MAPNYLTVTALTYALKRLIEENVSLDDVWIKGEISNFTAHSSGHFYFTLKDENARLSCVMFRSQARRLSFHPENGQAVMVTGRMSVYEKSGNYQLYIDQMEADGRGALYQAFDLLKQKLAEEGLFDPGRKRPIPSLPRKIGLITSPTGAAVQDMINILRRRLPNLDILVIPALVQGEEAPASLIKALEAAAKFRELDLIIIGRGGGSIEELWAFNDEKLARAIADFPKPVISAVGHETDFTIADFVADLRAPTPSAAAELAVPDSGTLIRNLQTLETRLTKAMMRDFQVRRRELQNILKSRAFADPLFELNKRRQDIDGLTERMVRATRQSMKIRREQFYKLLGKLDALSPLATMERGYSIVQKLNGVFVKRSDQVEIGERIQVKLVAGKLECEVLDKETLE